MLLGKTEDSPVFVVDDSPTLRALVTYFVKALGGMPVTLESGEQCLEAMKTCTPAMILMDLEMAGLAGDLCCQQIKSQQSSANTPVVMMTTASQPELVRRCLLAGADDFLPKPIQRGQLAKKIETLWEAHRAPRISSTGRRRLLLVSREGASQAALEEALGYAGFHVLRPPRRDEAHALLAPGAPEVDAVLVELSGDEASDVQLLRKLRGDNRGEKKRPVLGMGRVGLTVSNELRSLLDAPLFEHLEHGLDSLVSWVNVSLRRVAHDLRVSTRVPYFNTVAFRARGTDAWCSGFSSNLSLGGAFVRTLTPLEPSSELEVRGLFGEEETSRAVVAWSNQYVPASPYRYPIGMGIRFLDPNFERLGRALRRPSGEGAASASP